MHIAEQPTTGYNLRVKYDAAARRCACAYFLAPREINSLYVVRLLPIKTKKEPAKAAIITAAITAVITKVLLVPAEEEEDELKLLDV
jgi:hypothetical protein